MHHRSLRNMSVSRWPKPALYQATLYYCRCHCTLQLGHSLADRFLVSVDWLQSDAVVLRSNDMYLNTPTYNTTAWRNLVSCQEVGRHVRVGPPGRISTKRTWARAEITRTTRRQTSIRTNMTTTSCFMYSHLNNRLNLLCGVAHRRISPDNVNIHGLRPNQICRTKQHSYRESRSVTAYIGKRQPMKRRLRLQRRCRLDSHDSTRLEFPMSSSVKLLRVKGDDMS